MTNAMQDIRQTIEEAQNEICREWEADTVNVHGDGFTLRWEDEVEEPIDNVHTMVGELRTVAEHYPEAEINAHADREGFNVSAWFPEEDDEGDY